MKASVVRRARTAAWRSCVAPSVSWRAGPPPSVGAARASGGSRPCRPERRLTREHDAGAVGRQPRIGRDGEAVEVVGASGSGHGLLRAGLGAHGCRHGRGASATAGSRQSTRWSTGYHRAAMAAREQLSLRLEPGAPAAEPPATLAADVAASRRPSRSTPPTTCSSRRGAAYRALAFVGPAERAGTRRRPDRRRDGAGPRVARCRSSPGSAVRVDARSAVLDGELVAVDGAGRADDDGLRDAPQRARRAGRSRSSRSTCSTSTA